MLLLGYDVGSSSIKATLLDSQSGEALSWATSPKQELDIIAEKPGWAEQNPQTWWENVINATQEIKSKSGFQPGDVKAIGISYQMHGLVAVDKNKKVLRPAIIWCDSRAVQAGLEAAETIGKEKSLQYLLNLPGNFTASKLKWVKDNEPDIYKKIYKIMLPGDYIAMKMTERITTTPSGLSEAILWDYKSDGLAGFVLESLGLAGELIPDVLPSFSEQGQLTESAAEELGLKAGTKITYRAGDQPNNALSLGVLEPGQIAVTAGTSGVVYTVTDKANYDNLSRVNTFVHVNHTPEVPRYGILLCVNGSGILNSWLKHNFTSEEESAEGGMDYEKMNVLAAGAPVGSEGLVILPFGNGAERTLENRDLSASVHNLNFNIHTKAHFLRAAQEGIVFALNFGLDIMRNMGIELKKSRAPNANMFLSPLFSEAFATVTGTEVELYDTDGSQGAARGAGIGAGIYEMIEDAFIGLKPLRIIPPDATTKQAYLKARRQWQYHLNKSLKS